MKPTYIILGILIIGSIIYALCTNKEKFNKYTTTPYPNSCEFNEECMWDTARWVQMSNGMEGVCTLHGIACPAFSKNHVAASVRGLSPTMIDNNYYASLIKQNPFIGDNANYALSDTWGLNPPVINHYNRFGPMVRGSQPNEYFDGIGNFDGETAIELGNYPTNAG